MPLHEMRQMIETAAIKAAVHQVHSDISWMGAPARLPRTAVEQSASQAELNRAYDNGYSAGYAAAQRDIRAALGCK